jgi:hypothetical protein
MRLSPYSDNGYGIDAIRHQIAPAESTDRFIKTLQNWADGHRLGRTLYKSEAKAQPLFTNGMLIISTRKISPPVRDSSS